MAQRVIERAQTARLHRRVAKAAARNKAALKALKVAQAGVVAAQTSKGAVSYLRAARKEEAAAARALCVANGEAEQARQVEKAHLEIRAARKVERKAKIGSLRKDPLAWKTTVARRAAEAAAERLVQALVARADGLKMLKRAARTAARKAQRKELRKQSGGSSSPYGVFLKTALQGLPPGPSTLQAAATEWKGKSDAEKQPYIRKAAENCAKYQQLTAAAKDAKPVSCRSAFFRQHFATAYKEAKQSTANGKEAFKLASRIVNAKWQDARQQEQ
eukprot:TRINITY_DN13070_c0_g1_i1.p1 TRINITY_DN13070_c0_g1~~TRINITY_DN13070_c0_g1_i1.p1  ORF type:complete len:274 (+),score=15.80 TRINITY_DN13070_c0_g1_i1:246-1067(+)